MRKYSVSDAWLYCSVPLLVLSKSPKLMCPSPEEVEDISNAVEALVVDPIAALPDSVAVSPTYASEYVEAQREPVVPQVDVLSSAGAMPEQIVVVLLSPSTTWLSAVG